MYGVVSMAGGRVSIEWVLVSICRMRFSLFCFVGISGGCFVIRFCIY